MIRPFSILLGTRLTRHASLSSPSLSSRHRPRRCCRHVAPSTLPSSSFSSRNFSRVTAGPALRPARKIAWRRSTRPNWTKTSQVVGNESTATSRTMRAKAMQNMWTISYDAAYLMTRPHKIFTQFSTNAYPCLPAPAPPSAASPRRRLAPPLQRS